MLYDKFKELSDDYLFIKNKHKYIHDIFKYTNFYECVSYDKK